MIEQTVWHANYGKYRTVLAQGLVYGIAMTGEGMIVAEVRSALKMRLLVLADPRTMTVVHRCNPEIGAPCWHLAMGVELMAFAGNRRLTVQGKRPLAVVKAVNRCVGPEDVGQCRDITGAYFEYAGLPQKGGNFKLIKTIQQTTPGGTQERKKGFWWHIMSRLSLAGGTFKW